MASRVELTWQTARRDKIKEPEVLRQLLMGPSSPYDPVVVNAKYQVSLSRYHSRSKAAPTALTSAASPSPDTVVGMSTIKSLQPNTISLSQERSEGLAKILMTKGSRLLRRQTAKSNGTSIPGECYTETLLGITHKSWESLTGAHGESKRNIRYSLDDDSWRPPISRPYNFQHLAHTHANQGHKLKKASHHEVVHQFTAIRACQKPRRELQGIKAENLHIRNSSLQGFRNGPPTPARRQSSSRPPSLSHTLHKHLSVISETDLPKLSYSRSVENFSQPCPGSYQSRSPITPPPRVSSRHAVSDFSLRCASSDPPPMQDEHIGHCHAATYSSHNSPVIPTFPVQQNEDFDPSTTPHAVTTPDEIALPLKLLHELAKSELPESPKPEVTTICTKDSVSEADDSTSDTSQQTSSHQMVFPSPGSPLPDITIRSSSCSQTYFKDDASITIAGEFDKFTCQNKTITRLSTTSENHDFAWEDDVDYCYEHAAEADCNFDWDRKSDEVTDDLPESTNFEPQMDRQSIKSDDSNHNFSTSDTETITVGSRFRGSPARPSSIPLKIHIPELVLSRNSTKSSTSSLAGPLTPHPSLSYSDGPLDLSKNTKLAEFEQVLCVSGDNESPFMLDDTHQKLIADGLSEQFFPFPNENSNPPSDCDNWSQNSLSPGSSLSIQDIRSLSRSTMLSRLRWSSELVTDVPDLMYSRGTSRRGIIGKDNLESYNALAGLVNAPPVIFSTPFVPPTRGESLTKGSVQQSRHEKTDSRHVALKTLDAQLPFPLPTDFQRDRSNSDAAIGILDRFPSPPTSTTQKILRNSKSTSALSCRV